MPRSNADLLALKSELTNDPQSLGLVAPPAIDDVGNADKLNAVSAGDVGYVKTLLIDREAIPIHEIFLNIDRDEYAALAEADRMWLNGISSGGVVNPRAGGEVREGLLQLFGSQSETRTNLLAIMQEPASRINQMHKAGLLEQGGSVTPSDISQARQAS